jgi:hypothetical protein
MYQALRGITGSPAWFFISPGDVLDVIGDRIFRSTEPQDFLAGALVTVVVLLAASVIVLERRVRGVEVVT